MTSTRAYALAAALASATSSATGGLGQTEWATACAMGAGLLFMLSLAAMKPASAQVKAPVLAAVVA